MYYRAHLDRKKVKLVMFSFQVLLKEMAVLLVPKRFRRDPMFMTKNIHSSEHNVGVSYQALQSHALRVWSQANYW